MRFLKQTNIDFVAKRRVAIAISLAAVVLTVVLIFTRGLNFGVDFAGGTEIQLRFDTPVDADVVRDAMRDIGFEQASVQVFGDPADNEYLIRVERPSLMTADEHRQIVAAVQQQFGQGATVSEYDPEQADAIEIVVDRQLETAAVQQAVEQSGLRVDEVRSTGRGDRYQYTVVLEGVSTSLQRDLAQTLGEGHVDLRRVEYVGPQVGQQLRTRGLLSLLYAVIFILIYLAIRFDFRFAPGAVLALAHDAFLTVGFYSLTGLEFNLTSIAAILTVIGYSVNDTVVIYDRVRENLERFQGRDLPTLLNQSINETLSRTVLTSGTTLVALAGLWLYAQGTIWDFAVAMTWGIVVGTYSTLFVATPMVLWIDKLLSGKTKAAPARSGGTRHRAA